MKTIVLFLALFAGLNIQASDIKWGELIPSGKRVKAPSIIGQDGEHIFLLRYTKYKTFIDKYTIKNLSLKSSIELNLKYKDKKLNLIANYMFGKNPIILSSFYNKKNKKYYFFVQKINKSTLKPSKPQPVGSYFISRKISFSASSTAENPRDRSFYISPDGSHGYFIALKNTESNIETKKVTGLLLNSEFEEEAKQEFSMPYVNSEFVTLKSELADNGLFYILGYNQIKGKSGNIISRETTFRDDIWLIVIDPESGELDKTQIETEKDVSMLSFAIASNGDICVSGLSRASLGVDGAFSILFSATLEELNSEYVSFEDDFITKSWSDKEKAKLDKRNKKADKKGKERQAPTLYNYYIDYVLENPDGSFTTLAEQYYVVVRTTTTTSANGGTTTTTNYYYYYNDIIAINFTNEGNFNWKTVIEKRQYSVNDGGFYSSYFPVNIDGNLSLIFNQREIDIIDDKEDLSNRAKKTAAKKTLGVKVTIDQNGEQDKSVLFEFDEDEKFKLAPKYCSYIGDHLVFLYAKNRKGNKLGILDIE